MWNSARKSKSPSIAVKTTAARTALGRFSKNPVRKSRHSARAIDARIKASGVCAPALSFTADCDSPPATGTVARCCKQICEPQSEKFLARVQCITMFCCKSASGRYALDVGEQQTAGGQRKD